MRYSVMTSDMRGPFAGGAWLCAGQRSGHSIVFGAIRQGR
jgi:hypothetical protein